MSEIIHPDSEKGKLVRDISEIIHGDYYNFQEQAAAVMARIGQYKAFVNPLINGGISYEDIEKAALEDYQKQTKYDNAYDRQNGFIEGAKWTLRMIDKQLQDVRRSKPFCSCSFVIILRDVKTDVAYCSECGKEVNEQN